MARTKATKTVQKAHRPSLASKAARKSTQGTQPTKKKRRCRPGTVAPRDRWEKRCLKAEQGLGQVKQELGRLKKDLATVLQQNDVIKGQLEEERRLHIRTPAVSMETAEIRSANSSAQKLVDIKPAKSTQEEQLKKLQTSGYKRTNGSKKSSKLKMRLHRKKWQHLNLSNKKTEAAQKAMLNQLKAAVNFEKQTINWEALSGQFIGAFTLKAYNRVITDELKTAVLFENLRYFFGMIGKRGLRYLWDESVYFYGDVTSWLERFLFASDVEKKGECLVRSIVKKKKEKKDAKKAYRSMYKNPKQPGQKVREQFTAATIVSMINPRNFKGEWKEEMFTPRYDAGYYCDNKACMKTQHIYRQSTESNKLQLRNKSKKDKTSD